MQLSSFFAARVPGFENARLAATGAQIGHSRVAPDRRPIHAHARQDVLEARHFDDAIARSAYPIDIHNPSGSGHDDAPSAGRAELRDSVPVSRADQSRTAARCRPLHLDDARSAGIDAADADGDDARAGGRHGGGARARAARAARRRRSSELRARLVADGVDFAQNVVNAAIVQARAYGVAVTFADLGEWGSDELRSEYDPRGPEIRLNLRVAEAARAGRPWASSSRWRSGTSCTITASTSASSRIGDRAQRERAAGSYARDLMQDRT